MSIQKMLFKTRRGLFVLLLLFAGCIYLVYKLLFPSEVATDATHVPATPFAYIFPGVSGPGAASVVKPGIHTSWRSYSADNPSAMAILLTDTSGHWLGLAHGLTNIGIPFIITTSAAEALRHKVVMVYPIVSGRVLGKEDLQAIAAIPRNGGTLIAANVYGGGLNEVFDYDSIVTNVQHKLMMLGAGEATAQMESIFSDVINRQIVLTDGRNASNMVPTVGYTKAKSPLISFEDGTGCFIYKDYGVGKAYALGMDIGNYFMRYMNGRGFDVSNAYVNKYEAGIDVLLRTIKQIYVAGNKEAVTINTVPYNKPLALVITHDIDFTRSIVNAAKYAQMESDSGIKTTYFIQTKYIRDWNDDIFFDEANLKYLQQVNTLGMEIGSHSVAHSRTFSKFEMGSGTEAYPQYQPFVKERLVTKNATILGELRVSKFLLEHFAAGIQVRSFRPGHLQYPFVLPQALEAAGYTNSSAVTGGNVQTNLPYMMMYNREFDATMDIVEMPVAVEDELGLPMLQRLDSTLLLAQQLSKYGGMLNILIHTDILGQKFEYEQHVIGKLKNKAWVTTISDMGAWWRDRNSIAIAVATTKGRHTVTVTSGSGHNIKGLTLQVPHSWQLFPGSARAKQDGDAVILEELNGQAILSFK